MTSRHGFTLIELTVGIGVLLILFGSILTNYNTYSDRQRVRQAALTVRNNLRLAQTKAVAVEKPVAGCSIMSGMEVNFTDNSYTIQARCDEGLAGQQTSITLPSGVVFSPIPEPIEFSVLSRTAQTGSGQAITLVGPTASYQLRVSESGDIADEGFQ